jgi:indole-3-glycerol phosphate synthase
MLETILSSVRRRIPALAEAEADWRSAAVTMAPARGFRTALARDGLQVIGEIKRRSPSAGAISPGLDPVGQAQAYERGGAAAVSVLTEEEFFGGSLDDLAAVRDAVNLPVLRKDFVLHPAQVWQARAAGADAVLLIVAALTATELEVLLAESGAAGLDALVEAHTAEEAATALALGAEIVGVNNRDLRTFRTDLRVAESVAPLLAGTVTKVAESGVSSPEGAARMAAAGYDAILVGEAAVRAADPAAFVASLVEAGT